MAGTIALSCNQCGGGLEVPDGSRFLTCGFCGARLAVKHEGNAFFTEVLERVAAAQAGVEELRVQRELDLLDAEWEKSQSHWNPARNREGRYTAGFCLVGAGVMLIAALMSQRAQVQASLIAGVLVLGGAGGLILGLTGPRERRWREAEAAHRARREPLVRRAELRGEDIV